MSSGKDAGSGQKHSRIARHKSSEMKLTAKTLFLMAVAVTIQVIFLTILANTVSALAKWIEITLTILSLILVLIIYSREQSSAFKMLWIMILMLFPVFGVLFYAMVGLNLTPKTMRRRFEEVDETLKPLIPDRHETIERLTVSDPEAASVSVYLERYANAPLFRRTQVAYYSDTAEALEAQIEAMKQAEHFIFIETHCIEDKESWSRVEPVLIEKASKGVDIRLIYDDIGIAEAMSKGFEHRMESHGIHCLDFNPAFPAINFFLNNRDHRKITVVDNQVAFTGGYNFADEYFNITHPYGIWKDAGIRMNGEAVQMMTLTFIEMWNASKGKNKINVQPETYLIPLREVPESDGYVQPYADSPMDKENVGENVYISIINKARRYCWFMTPYLVITDELQQALVLAAKRGVDVRIITPGIPDKKYVYQVTRSYYSALVRKGVRIFEWTPGFDHAKLCVADDSVATCGTVNLDYRSLYHHFENGCYLVHGSAVDKIKQDFLKTFPECREVTEEYKEKRRMMSAWQLILRLVAPLL